MKKNQIIETAQSKSFKVYVRVRPFNQYQKQQPNKQQYLNLQQTQITIKTKNNQQQEFTFDKIYPYQSNQQQIFHQVAQDVVQNAFLGINGTLFCYGQTSSGKTYTIVGEFDQKNTINEGLLPRTLRQVINRKNSKIQNIKESKIDIRIKISMVQIYNQKVKDLLDLNKNDLKLRQNKKQGVFIQYVTEKYIVTTEEGMQFVNQGLLNRTVGRTNLNAYSSRSHMLFIITIHSTNFQTRQAKLAKITLIDLAGSQKVSKTGVQGKMLIQAKNINLSLSNLGKVIQALSDRSNHVPYRDSKLTRLLQQSIGGNSLTRLIINISPSSINQYETGTSLRFGARAKLIKNRPKINKQYTIEQLLGLLQKAQIKIKQQMKIIAQYERILHGRNFQIKKNLKQHGDQLITLHIVDDQDQYQFDDLASLQTMSVSKSVSYQQQKNYHSSSLRDSSSLFSQTAQFNLENMNRSLKKKPQLKSYQSMKTILIKNEDSSSSDQNVETNQFKEVNPISSISVKNQKNSLMEFSSQIRKSSLKSPLLDKREDIIQEQNQQSLLYSNQLKFQQIVITENNISSQQIDNTNFLTASINTVKKDKLFQSLSNSNKINQINKKTTFYQYQSKDQNNQQKQFNTPNTNNSTIEQKKQIHSDLSTQIKTKEQIFEQIKLKFKQQLQAKIKKQLSDQLRSKILSQLKDQLRNNIYEEIKQQKNILNTKIENMNQSLNQNKKKLEQMTIKCQQTKTVVQQQKQTIEQKNRTITQLKDKYKAKKTQINKQISKLKTFWQIQNVN